MSSEDNKALVRRFFEEVFNQKQLERAGEFVAPDYLDHAAVPGQGPGLEGAKQQRWTMYFAAIPDIHATIEDLVAEGDKVAVRFTVEGTRAVGIAGLPAHWQAFPGQRHLHLPHGRGEGRGELGADANLGPDAAVGCHPGTRIDPIDFHLTSSWEVQELVRFASGQTAPPNVVNAGDLIMSEQEQYIPSYQVASTMVDW